MPLCVKVTIIHLFMSVSAGLFFFPPSSRQLLMHLIYGTPAECVCVCVSVCVVCVKLCGNSQTHSVDEGMLLSLTHLMIWLLPCDQYSGQIPHNRKAMSNAQQQHGLSCPSFRGIHGNRSLNKREVFREQLLFICRSSTENKRKQCVAR